MENARSRSNRERETLIFKTPEEAREWNEAVGERLQQENRNGVRRRREVVADAVADEFAKAGAHVELIKEPWTHTATEHAEAQQLVDIAFARDLPEALKTAQQSDHYPRNVDLFHDVLTGEMYDLVLQHELNRQPILMWALLALGALAVVMLLTAVIIFFLP